MFIIKDISWRIYMTRKLQLVVIFHVDVGIGVFFSVGIDSVSLLYTWRWIDHCSLCHDLVQRSIPAINKVSSLVIISYISYCFQFTISSIGYKSKASISQIKRTHLLQTCNQSIIELSDYRTLLNYINR